MEPGHPRAGHTAVDFEERVNFRRLHDYRLARAKQALAESELGAILCLDANNIRYISGTVIGERSRDKISRYALLTGTGDPHIWDLGRRRPITASICPGSTPAAVMLACSASRCVTRSRPC